MGAFEMEPGAPRATSMGGAGVALAGDAWAAQRNPALSAWCESQAGLAWSQLFGLPELGRESVNVIGNSRNQPWALGAATFGSELYRESQFNLSLAREFHSSMAVGLELRGQWLQIQNYTPGKSLAFSAGVLARPLEGVVVGAVWKNLNEPRVSGYRDRIAESLEIGTAVDLGAEGVVVADVVQERRFPAEYRVGAEARVLQQLWIRVGARAQPLKPSAGVELALGRWHFLYAIDRHPDLGVSNELGLSIRFH